MFQPDKRRSRLDPQGSSLLHPLRLLMLILGEAMQYGWVYAIDVYLLVLPGRQSFEEVDEESY